MTQNTSNTAVKSLQIDNQRRPFIKLQLCILKANTDTNLLSSATVVREIHYNGNDIENKDAKVHDIMNSTKIGITMNKDTQGDHLGVR